MDFLICPERVENEGMFSLSIVQYAIRRVLADGAMQPIETQTIPLGSGGVPCVLRTASSLARKGEVRHVVLARDPLFAPSRPVVSGPRCGPNSVRAGAAGLRRHQAVGRAASRVRLRSLLNTDLLQQLETGRA